MTIRFVWDKILFKQQGYSLKRLVFLYETAISYPQLKIVAGTTVDCLNHQLAALSAKAYTKTMRLVTQTPNCPQLIDQVTQLQQQHTVTLLAADSLIPSDRKLPLKRFSRFWHSGAQNIVLS